MPEGGGKKLQKRREKRGGAGAFKVEHKSSKRDS